MSVPSKSEFAEYGYRKIDTSTSWEKFRRGLWNPETREVLGRTRNMWGK